MLVQFYIEVQPLSHLEASFSRDGAQSREVKWIADQFRAVRTLFMGLFCVMSLFGVSPGQAASSSDHDFDFEMGTWKTHISRLLHPLTGSTTWVEYNGSSTVRKVWDGRANLLELKVDGPNGHIEALSLRLYNPASQQWSLNFSNSAAGTLGTPTVGEFNNGRGEFFDQEALGARMILVRFVISDITPRSCHFEQAFSVDGGKSWEVNWIADDTLMPGTADAVP